LYNIYIGFFQYVLSRPDITRFVGVANYATLFSDGDFLHALFETFLMAAILWAIELAFGLGQALLLSQDFRGVTAFRILVGLPILTIPAGTALVWRNLFFPETGLVNGITQLLGWGVINWTSNYVYSSILIILIDVWQWTPFFTIILLAGLLSLPKEPYEAAKVDGLSTWTTFRRITMPMLMPVISIVSILRILDLLKLMDPIAIITKGGQGTETLSYFIWRVGFKSLDMGYTGAIANIYWLAVWVLANVLLRLFKVGLE
jgi:multiple sugar transport system permease protein